MDVWAAIYANLVHHGLKGLEEVPQDLKATVEKMLGLTNEPV